MRVVRQPWQGWEPCNAAGCGPPFEPIPCVMCGGLADVWAGSQPWSYCNRLLLNPQDDRMMPQGLLGLWG